MSGYKYRFAASFFMVMCLHWTAMNAGLFFLTSAQAEAPESFFKGKTLRVSVDTGPGGGTDTYARLLVRHMPRYIPGNPVMIVQNMPGGGGTVAVNYLYERAPRDGTAFGTVPSQAHLLQLVKKPGARYDFTKMTALGSISLESTLLFTRKDRFASLQEIIRSDKRARISSSSLASNAPIIARLIGQVLDQKLFDLVLGYPSGRDYALAVVRGEVDGSALIKSAFMLYVGDSWKKGDIVVVAQTATLEGGRDPDFPDAPLISELAKTKEAKRLVNAGEQAANLWRPYWLPPGVPEDRVKILREAFWKTLHDEKLLKEAEKMGRPIKPMRGEKLQKLWLEVLTESPPEAIKLFEEFFVR